MRCVVQNTVVLMFQQANPANGFPIVALVLGHVLGATTVLVIVPCLALVILDVYGLVVLQLVVIKRM